MAAFLDACRFNPTAGSTTNWTYSSAVSGYNSPALAGVVNGTLYKYRAESGDLSQWEIGEGAYNTGTGVLARTTVLFNSSGTGTASGQSGAGTKINFSTIPQVAVVALAEDLPNLSTANTFTAANTFTGALASTRAPSAGPHFDTSGATALSIANGASAAITVTGGFYYLIYVAETANTGWHALYMTGNSGVQLISGSGNWLTSTSPAAGNYSVAWDSGTATYRIYNNQGATGTFGLVIFRAA